MKKKNKLSFKEKQLRHKISILQKGDWVFYKNKWRQIRFIHGWTIAFDSYHNNWTRSKLAYYNIMSIWRQIKFVIKENHDKPNWKLKK